MTEPPATGTTATAADQQTDIDDTSIPRWVRRSIFLWWTIAVALWLTHLLARELRSLLIQITLAFFISFAIEPAVDLLQKRGMRRGAATGVSLLMVFIGMFAFLGLMGQLIATQLIDLVEALPDYIRSTQTWASERFGVEIEANDLIEQVESGQVTAFANDLSRYLLSIGSTVVSVLFQALTITLFTYYITADGPRLRQLICSVLPPARQAEVLRVWELATNKTGAYISSRFILAVFSAVFHWIVFTVLDLPSAVALALWVGIISQFIPTIGTYLAGILPALVAVGINPTTAIWVIIAVAGYQQVENYILQPRITAQTLDLHPAVTIAAVLAGTTLFGAPGALLALPVVATAGGFVSAYIERHPVVDEESAGRHPRQIADPNTTDPNTTDQNAVEETDASSG